MSYSRAVPIALSTLFLALVACQNALSAPDTDLASREASMARLQHEGDVLLEDVVLEPGITADIHVRLFVNEEAPCSGRDRTALLIPGSSHTANSFNRLAEELFTGPRESQMCRLAALDFPGHGQSSLPGPGLLFGDLTLQHYLEAAAGVLDRLPDHNVHIGAIVGHSQGTMIIQMLQAHLVRERTNLREAYGIRKAVLLGPSMPAALPWLWSSNTAVLGLLQQLVTDDPALGRYIRGPAWAFQAAWFVNTSGDLAPLAPPVATIAANGWNSRLPLVANLQTLGAAPFSRPSIPSGIFAAEEGTDLQIVNMADDPASLPFEGQALLEYLTGDAEARISLVLDPTGSHSAVHSAMLIDELVDDVRSAMELPRRP